MTPILSPRTSASSMWCVVRSMARPRRTERRRVQSSRRATGSIPAVGSSRTMKRELPARAMEVESLRFWPPLSSEPRWAARSSRWKTARRFLASRRAAALDLPLRREKKTTCSERVRRGKRMSCWGQTPSVARRRCMPSFVRMSWPRTVARVSRRRSGGRRPVRQAMVVVLPAPLWPRRQKISDLATANETPSTALKSCPNVLCRFATVTTTSSWNERASTASSSFGPPVIET
mmetsp:Transcript_8814/g.27898  ORF Transcript_8814/g.27898 Transcript_8814/m.27898 type:complete len:233 (+) Transcript_8814:2870-3568(+)